MQMRGGKFINSVFIILAKSLLLLLSLMCVFIIFYQEHAFENSQKYKEGKFIIEMAHMIKDNGWL